MHGAALGLLARLRGGWWRPQRAGPARGTRSARAQLGLRPRRYVDQDRRRRRRWPRPWPRPAPASSATAAIGHQVGLGRTGPPRASRPCPRTPRRRPPAGLAVRAFIRGLPRKRRGQSALPRTVWAARSTSRLTSGQGRDFAEQQGAVREEARPRLPARPGEGGDATRRSSGRLGVLDDQHRVAKARRPAARPGAAAREPRRWTGPFRPPPGWCGRASHRPVELRLAPLFAGLRRGGR